MVGLLGWLAGRYYVKEARRLTDGARAIPMHTRKGLVTKFTERMHRTG